MKKIIILISLLIVALISVAQEPAAGGLDTDNPVAAPASIRIRCAPSVASPGRPLFVVDGSPLDTMDINKIRPELIESVYILKDAQAKAIYGCRATAGVVIITLRPRILYVNTRNSYTGETVAVADLRVRIGKQTNENQMPENRIVAVSSFEDKTTLEVSAIGYNSVRLLVSKGASDTLLVLLDPVAQLLPEIIVKGIQNTRICRRTISCGATGVSVCTIHVTNNAGRKETIGMSTQPIARLYPNPAAAGSRVTIQLPESVNGKLAVNFYSLTGQILKQVVDKSNTGLINFSLPAAFSGVGVLLVQDDAKNVLIKEKVLVQ